MRAFNNISHDGNEKAIRRGRTVPEGDVNLAYVKVPELSPEDNIVIVDTSRLVEENISESGSSCKLYYANSLGILVDANGNMVIEDEFPVVTDVFSIDEDYNINPGNEYTNQSILGYRHASRYFHLDFTGLAMPGEELDYKDDHIKVVDNRGVEYDNYRITIVAAYFPNAAHTEDTWAYRVFAYVDTDEEEELYLKYNKIEMDTDGNLVRRDLSYQEILNPEPYFDYVPEESDVVDPNNRRKKIYSSKPITYKERMLGKPDDGVDGYKVYVPKKAIGDPRIYQLFRWRVKCTFQQDSTIDPTREDMRLKCGVIVTNKDLGKTAPSRAPYSLYNLQRSAFNVNNLKFINPAKTNHNLENQRKRAYWFVNIDEDDLSQYDLLIWAPNVSALDVSKYSGKISDFISVYGGTLFFDTNNYVDIFRGMGGRISRPAHPKTGDPRWSSNPLGNNSTLALEGNRFRLQNTTHALIDGDKQLGGWQLGAGTIDIPSYSQYNYVGNDHLHGFIAKPRGYTSLIEERSDSSTTYYPTLIARPVKKGAKVISTMGVAYAASANISYIDGKTVRSNLNASRVNTGGDYFKNINGAYVEGAMKLLYNIALYAVRNKVIDNADQTALSTTWEYSTPWKASWVIDASDGVLTETEKAENDFLREPKDIFANETEPVWKRKLSNKTVKQMIDEAIQPILDNPQTRSRVDKTATRHYEIEVTNPYVETGSTVVENDYPMAYTEAYTPKFEVPIELGPHIIREEVDESGVKGRVAQYDNATRPKMHYPDQPYAGQVIATYADSEEYALDSTTAWQATGTARGTVRNVITIPPSSTTTSVNTEMSWWDARVDPLTNPGTSITPGDAFYTNGGFPAFGMVHPDGLKTWQQENYYTSAWGNGNLCWPHYGITDRLVLGSSGDLVKFAQDAMNRFQAAKFFASSVGNLRVDGHFGSTTSKAVRDFQTTLQARYVDGVIDAETWYLIATQVNRLAAIGIPFPITHTGYQRFYRQTDRIRQDRISDGNETFWGKRSWIRNGPSVIWELFAITFDQAYKWHGVTVVPHLEGSAQTLMVRSIHVTNERSLQNYNSEWGQLIYMPHRPGNGQRLYIPIGPYTGDTIIVGVGQDQGNGFSGGTGRMLGVKDIVGHTRITETVTTPATTHITSYTENFNFEQTGSIEVDSFTEKVLNIQPPKFPSKYDSVDNVYWTGITTDNPEVIADINSKGRATFNTSLIQTSVTENKTSKGPKFPDFKYYSMDEGGNFDPVPETGYASKAEGVKLLCDSRKRSVGFPAMPTAVGADEAQRHYVKLTLNTQGTASDVRLGFYDRKQQEFVTTVDNRPEMSYLEYIRRGPHNIYIAVLSEAEEEIHEILPVDDDAPRLPFKWAMPVYGVCTKGGSKITLESLPSRLGAKEIWPIAVREGKFTRNIKTRSRHEGPLTGWISGYQDMLLEAFYSLPEAELGGYSSNFGQPNSDVVNEEPVIVDDNVIHVRQAPILMVTHPTSTPNPADPYRPVFTLYKRATRDDPWVEQPMSEIEDYNVSTGEIYLKDNLESNDASLLRVDYTSKRRSYYFKRHEDQILNLNSYSGHTRDLIGEAIYVYIVPHYVKDPNGNIIPESVNERTLRISLSPNVFNPLDPAYDPLAIQLGVVYQSTALDLDKVSVLDTRRRGGGVADGSNVQEIERIVKESATYWDTGYAVGSSYQKSGFVVVRLPEELKNDFTEDEIRKIVNRNITSGVHFKLEDLHGREWN